MANQAAGKTGKRAAVLIAGGVVNATNIAETINNYGPSTAEIEAIIERRLAAMVETLTAREAVRDDGVRVGRQTIRAAAQRLDSAELLDLQAIHEVERAVETARSTISYDAANLDSFVKGVFANVALTTARGDFDSGAEAIDAGLANLEAEYRGSRIALLEQAIRIDELRRDAPAVAQRIALLVGVGAPDAVPEWLPTYRDQYDRYFHAGQTVQRFPLAVAVELARRMLRTARDAEERRNAAQLFGHAQYALGGFELTATHFVEAIDCYRRALGEADPVTTAEDWTGLHVGLGDALYGLAMGEPGTTHLEAARDAYRAAADAHAAAAENWTNWASITVKIGNIEAAISQRTSTPMLMMSAVKTIVGAIAKLPRDVATLEWGAAQKSLGDMCQQLAVHDPEPGGYFFALAEKAYSAALDATPRNQRERDWSRIEYELGTMYAFRGLRTGEAAWCELAIAKHRNALEFFTRDRVPLYWLRIQTNLALATLWLGRIETGTARIEAAVASFRTTLEVADRATLPEHWATCSGHEGLATLWLADRRDDLALAIDARALIVNAVRVARNSGHLGLASYLTALLPEAAAVIARLGGPHDLEEP